MKPIGVLRFLGTNCDADVIWALNELKAPNKYIWWADHFDEADYSGFVLPGGFSYGDYLRVGALAARTPAMEDIQIAAKKGKSILGICNGFQILCEAGLLPGALTKNSSLKFQDQWVSVVPKNMGSHWTRMNSIMRLPIAHSMGRYIADESTLKSLSDNRQIWLEYKDNPNGSMKNIAGICNAKGNVAALMPHPERAMADWMGSHDGKLIFEVLQWNR